MIVAHRVVLQRCQFFFKIKIRFDLENYIREVIDNFWLSIFTAFALQQTYKKIFIRKVTTITTHLQILSNYND